jgi:mannose-6-phosphate isomerase
LYPLKFERLLKEKVWGGSKLSQFVGEGTKDNVGESWELSGVAGDLSIVSNGPLQGTSITSLIRNYKTALMGKKVYAQFGDTFPLLFKFIDAKQDLSVQLHPGDQLARDRHDSFGKTEVWYIVDAEDEARLILGFNRDVDEATYLRYLSEKRLPELLHSEEVRPGDSFFIAPGTVHAIGGGILLAEIQQTSDITYRIYDWDRPDLDGKMRELHTDMALAAIDYTPENPRLLYDDKENEPVPLCDNNYFTTNKLTVTNRVERSFQDIDSFVVYMCTEGHAVLEWERGEETMKAGDTVLIPSDIPFIIFNSNRATFLEVYIP